MRRPEDRPNVEGTRLCPQPSDPGRERNRWNNGDCLMLQISRFGPATDDLKIEKPPDEGTTRYTVAGEGKRERECQHVERPRDELGYQADREGFGPSENPLSQRVEEG